jgi:diguanylate cyclase (GGDEF)-like protein
MTVVPEREPLVLVVDDAAGTRLLAEAALRKAGYAVAAAADGGEGVAACGRLRPDLVLMDAVMPGMDGFSAVREIRRLPGGERVPIVMMTGLEDLASVQRAYEVGVTDFETKPINWLALGYRVGYILAASRALLDLARSEEKTRALVRAIPDLIFRIGEDGTVLDLVAGAGEGAAPPDHRPEGRKVEDVLPGEAAEQALRCVEAARSTGGIQRFEYDLAFDGDTRNYEARVVSLPEGESLLISRDMTDRKRAEERLSYMAYHDALTGLPNRVTFKERLEHEIANARRRKEMVGIILFDLDRFKEINDTLGHAAGDRLLVLVGERLQAVLRETDTVARVGGDEFCAILPGQNDPNGAVEACRRIRKSFSAPFLINEQMVNITASLGISMYPLDGDNPSDLVKNADIAMFRAKSDGRDSFQAFAEEMGVAMSERIRMEKGLRSACENGEFAVLYQPEVDLASGRIVAAEALVRWLPPDGGTILPEQFIPLAEETGMVVPMSEFVLRTACRQARDWMSRGFSPLRISVNLSPRLFQGYDLAGVVMGILAETGVGPESLELEITEATAMHKLEETVKTLWKLNGFSVRVAMDDFGTGYSSLACLRRFPIRLLKIDRTFIRDLERNAEDQAIVRAILAMAGALGIEVVAEGVERAEQRDLLKAFGCPLAQGYYFGRPMSAAEMTLLLAGPVTADRGCSSR